MIGFTKEVVFHPAKVNGVVVEKLMQNLYAGKDTIVVFPAGKVGVVSRDAIFDLIVATSQLIGMHDLKVAKHLCRIQNRGATIRFTPPTTMMGLPKSSVLVYSYDKVSESVIDEILHSNVGKLTVVEVR